MTQRETINKQISNKLQMEKWVVNISKDSKQFLIRFPKEMAELLKIKKGMKAALEIDTLKKDSKELKLRILNGKHK